LKEQGEVLEVLEEPEAEDEIEGAGRKLALNVQPSSCIKLRVKVVGQVLVGGAQVASEEEAEALVTGAKVRHSEWSLRPRPPQTLMFDQ
jgi:hypothetical protein